MLIYLDNNATTRVAPEVISAMLPYFETDWGNPSSAYNIGRKAGQAVASAREKVAALLNAEPRELVFTSCGTESDNTALFSALETTGRKHIVTTAVEHSAIMTQTAWLRSKGYKVTYIPVSSEGLIDPKVVADAIDADTALVSIMLANNETGVISPVQEIAKICKEKGVLCHTDAVQTPGKMRLDVKELGVDFLSLSAHKLHAPKGIGVLYVKHRTPFHAFVQGGHQEKMRRGGTENVPYIVGFGKAAELCMSSLNSEIEQVRALRDKLENGILRAIPHTRLNGHKMQRMCNTSNITFEYIEAEAILMLLNQFGICASSGSACTTGSAGPSHVLSAMGLSPMQARGSVRFSLSRYNTMADIDKTLEVLPPIITRLRALSPLNEAHPDNPNPNGTCPVSLGLNK